MKTFVPSTKTILSTAVIAVALFSGNLFAQSNSVTTAPGNGLNFSKDPVLQTASSTDLKQGAVYLVEDVMIGVDATVRIDSLVNGAKVTKIDDNSNGLGYKEAFQPEVKTGSVTAGKSYAVFTFKFHQANTTPALSTPVNLQ